MGKFTDPNEIVRAPEGVLFMSPDEVAAMMGDFGVRRAAMLMHTERFPTDERGTTIVGAVINASVCQPPPGTGS